MVRINAESSTPATTGYDEGSKIFKIDFQHGTICQYFVVPDKVNDEHVSSPAFRSYFE